MGKIYPEAFVSESLGKSWNLVSAVLNPNLLNTNQEQSSHKTWKQGLLYILKLSGSLMAQARADLEKKYALHKLIKLRKRRIFTSSNRLRLRYIVLYMGLLGGLAFASAPYFSAQESQAISQDVEVVASVEAPAQEEETVAAAEPVQNFIPNKILKASAIMKKPTPPKPTHKDLEIAKGGTISGALEAAGISRNDAYYAVKAMSEHYDPRQMKPGQKIKVDFKHLEGGDRAFEKFAVQITPVKEVIVSKNDEGKFTASVTEEKLIKRNYAVSTEIETSLYGSALRAGIPSQVVAEMIRLYSWSVDFQRDIRPGDKIEVFYETKESEDGNYKKYGDVLFANLGVGGRDKPIYRYTMDDGYVDYFESDGHSIRKTLMRTPVDGARLSSGFGMRKHPVLGYNKMHKGVDFAAPTGTPIYAAGDGTIDKIGRNGGYGNYVRIRHNSTLKTAYAHLHKFARGMGKGTRVKQGEVIGYIGSTGRSTGPHLHYEVIVNGQQKNPRSVDLPTGEQLKGPALAKFNTHMNELKNQYASLSGNLKLAKNRY